MPVRGLPILKNIGKRSARRFALRRTHNAIQASNLSRFERRAGDIRPYSNFLLRKKLLLAGLGPLGAVLGTGLHTAVDALGIQRTTDDVVTDARQVFDTAATDHDQSDQHRECRR